jgi:hypothetical protein
MRCTSLPATRLAPVRRSADSSLTRLGIDERMTLGPISAISAMVAPVVLITVGGLVVNGIALAWGQLTTRVFDLTHERATLVSGPRGELLDAASMPEAHRQRLSEIDAEVSMMASRSDSLRRVAGVLDVAIALLVLSVIGIGVAVAAHSLTLAYVALALVLAGTVTEFAAVATATSIALRGGGGAVQRAASRTGG